MKRLKNIFAQATDAPAATSRNRSLIYATASSGLAKIISVLLNMITIPIVVRVLGPDGYGLWTIITSIASFLVFADFGLSNGLVTVISEANGKRDRQTAIHAVSTTFFVLLGLAIVCTLAVAAISPHIPWASLLNLTHSRLAPEVPAAVTWFLLLEIAIVPALISQKVQIGYQEMHWTNTWQILGSILSFLGVLFAAWKGWRLVDFIILFEIGPIFAQIVSSFVLFAKRRPWLAPKLSAFNWIGVRNLGGTGGVFVLLQLLTLLGTYSDQIVLSRNLGLGAVAEYSLTQRLFTGASMIQFFLIPLWPAFGEALASGDHVWARLALRRTLLISLAVSTGSAVLIAIFERPLASMWVPQINTATPLLLSGFVAFSMVSAYGGTMSVFLNNRQTLRAQLVFFAAGSFAAIAAKVWLVRIVGISGVLWGTALGYGLFYMYPAWRLARKTIDNLRAEPNELQLLEN